MRLALTIAAAMLAPAFAHATPITYIETGIITGSLGGVAFTQAAVTFTVYGRSIGAIPVSNGTLYTSWGLTTVAIEGFGTATLDFSTEYGVFSAPSGTSFPPTGTTTSVGVGNISQHGAFLQIVSAEGGIYNLSTAFTLTGPAYATGRGGISAPTDLGTLTINSASGNATFSTTGDPTLAPEPASIALLGVGAIGLLGARRWRGISLRS